MELRHLRYFLAVAEDLHFGRAAARLHIAQPPLSRQIRNLEAELGITLFHRTRRRVQLTQAGQLFLEAARRVLADVEEAVRVAQRAGRGEIGRLLIGFVGTATCDVLLRALRVFRERFPEVILCLQELTTVQQVEALHEKRLDVGFLRPPIEDESLSLMVLTREPFVVAVSAAHPLSRQPQVPLRRLAGEAFVLFPRQAAPGFYDQVIRLCQRAGFSPNIAQEASQVHALLGLVAAGLGV
jgi:DNA-binding transcriptional LysR family regulator